jgi:hypothetical protein
MKPKISFLTLIFSISVFTLILFSCAKEELLPLINTSKVFTQPVIDEANLSASASVPFENKFQKEQRSKITTTLSETLESINTYVQARTDSKVAIRAFTCSDGGETLIVYNPDYSDLNFYNSTEFEIQWFKDGELVGNRTRLNCICKGKYAVIVIDNVSITGIGRAFYTGSACSFGED